MIRVALLASIIALCACSTNTSEQRSRQVLSDLHEQHGFPGATLAWVGPDENVRTLAVGMADPDSNSPMTSNSRMLIASIGKTFVAAAILSAHESGQLDLDAPIATYIGEKTWYTRLPNHQSLTLRQLLTHSAGLPDHVNLPAFRTLFQATRTEQQAPNAEALIGLILDREPLFAPGEGWSYSDTGYLVAARVLEATSQQHWTSVIEQQFLDPLKLKAIAPSNQRELPNLATGITTSANPFGLPERTLDKAGRLVWHPAIEDAGGGFVSTAGDLARWGRALFSGSLHSEDALKNMLAGVPVDKNRPGVTYGLGVVIEQSPEYGEVRGHRGWIPGYVSSLRYYPAYDVAIALQINSDVGMRGEARLFEKIEAAITDELLSDKPRNL